MVKRILKGLGSLAKRVANGSGLGANLTAEEIEMAKAHQLALKEKEKIEHKNNLISKKLPEFREWQEEMRRKIAPAHSSRGRISAIAIMDEQIQLLTRDSSAPKKVVASLSSDPATHVKITKKDLIRAKIAYLLNQKKMLSERAARLNN